jgi:hypothetical protein
MSANKLPLQIQKQLRKEALYGCAICGCPILEYVQIVRHDYVQDVQTILPENIVVLCLSHYIAYNNKELSESTLRHAKNSPYNKTHEQYAFILEGDMAVNIGKCKFVNTSRILVIDDFDIISIKREEERYILLDINFFDKLNNLIAIVSDNIWSAERMSRDWNIKYKPKHLRIENNYKNIIFEAKIESNNEITITTDGMYYNLSPIKITENQILLDGEEIAVDIKGTELRNYEVGIVAVTA